MKRSLLAIALLLAVVAGIAGAYFGGFLDPMLGGQAETEPAAVETLQEETQSDAAG